MNESMYEEACEYYEIVETTQGMNGYPSNLRKAVIGFGCFGEAEEFANHHKGKVVELCKRDGWQFWKQVRVTDVPFCMTASNFGAEYTALELEDRNNWWQEEKFQINDCIDESDHYEFLDWSSRVLEILEAFDALCENELVLLKEGKFDSIIKKYVIRYKEDVYTHIIGVVDESDCFVR